MNLKGFFNMADVNIGYDISVNTNGAENKIQAVSQATNNATNSIQGLQRPVVNANAALFGMTQVVRDLPFGFIAISNNLPILTDQFTSLVKTSGGVKAALSGMLSSMMGPAGIAFAISTVISAITTYSLANRGGKKAVDEHKDSVDSLSKSLYDLRNNLQKTSQMSLLGDLSYVQSEIAKIQSKLPRQGTMGQMAGTASPEDMKRLNELKQQQQAIQEIMSNMGMIESANNSLAEQRLALDKARNREQQKAAAGIIKDSNDYIDATNKALGLEKEHNKKLEDKVKLIRELGSLAFDSLETKKQENALMSDQQKMLIEVLKMTGQLEAMQGGKFSRPSMAGMSVPNKPDLPDFTKDIKDGNQEMIMAYEATFQTLEQAGRQMWTNIFGEANSLLEMFLQNMANAFMNMAAQNLAMKLFSLVPGGSIISTIFGGASAPSNRGGTGNQTTYIVMDSQVIVKAVVKTLPNALGYNQRLGLI